MGKLRSRHWSLLWMTIGRTHASVDPLGRLLAAWTTQRRKASCSSSSSSAKPLSTATSVSSQHGTGSGRPNGPRPHIPGGLEQTPRTDTFRLWRSLRRRLAHKAGGFALLRKELCGVAAFEAERGRVAQRARLATHAQARDEARPVARGHIQEQEALVPHVILRVPHEDAPAKLHHSRTRPARNDSKRKNRSGRAARPSERGDAAPGRRTRKARGTRPHPFQPMAHPTRSATRPKAAQIAPKAIARYRLRSAPRRWTSRSSPTRSASCTGGGEQSSPGVGSHRHDAEAEPAATITCSNDGAAVRGACDITQHFVEPKKGYGARCLPT